eukprot:TRINITY_DN8978_c0_g1_i1.p1 TRINITY_DN8978_c0_g1~~TRINITY_DN8978_c0_g1_i1.p1  ORF type:complete len:1304 (+),score=360.68 TRINITY_DN8978_c0_g1_i1:325-3912(+)
MKEGQEWIVVYLSLPGDPARKVRFFNVFHYMKNDFNTVKGQDRVFTIRLPEKGEKDDEEGWERVMAKLKEGISRHGEEAMEKLIQEIKKLDSERIHPGWNYCKFFAVKEGLAFIYESFQMYDEALMQYDELEALFSGYDVPEEQKLGIKGFGGTDVGDEYAAFLDSSKKPFRKQIVNNQITEFDFRQYIFARQSEILFKRELPVFVAERGLKFIKSFRHELEKNNFPPVFIMSWAFGAYLDLADNCLRNMTIQSNSQRVKKRQKRDKRQIGIYLADIYFNACLMLHEIGILQGFIPKDCNFYFGPDPHQPLKITTTNEPVSETSTEKDDTMTADDDTDDDTDNDAMAKGESQFEEKPPEIVEEAMDNSPVEEGNFAVDMEENAGGQEKRKKDFEEFSEKSERSEMSEKSEKSDKSKGGYSSKRSYRNLKSSAILSQSLKSVKTFDKLYVSITRRAIKSYRDCKRQRSVNWLQCKLSDLYFYRGKYTECASLLKKVVKAQHNGNEAWPPLLSAAFHKLCESYRKKNLYIDYVANLLALLSYESDVPVELREFYFSDLLRVIKDPFTLEKKLAKEALSSLVQIDIVPPYHLKFALDQEVVVECDFHTKSPLDLKIDSFVMNFIMESDLEVSMESQRGLILEATDILLPQKASGGTSQRVSLRLNPTMVGTYVCHKLWISIGKLLLTQSMEHAVWKREFRITITPSESTLALDVMSPPSLILQQTQHLSILINTKNDTVRSGVLSVSAPPELFLVHKSDSSESPSRKSLTHHENIEGPKPEVQITKKSLGKNEITTENIEATLTGINIKIPDCERNEDLEIHLPVRTNGTVAQTHEVTLELTYEKVTKEKFFLQTCMDLNFQHPFHIEQNMIPIYDDKLSTETKKIFLHLVITCICSGEIEIIDFGIDFNDCASFYKILNDPNESVHNTVIQSKGKTALLYEIETSKVSEKKKIGPAFNIKYKFLMNNKESYSNELIGRELLFQQKLSLARKPAEFLIQCMHPPSAEKGKRIYLEWHVTCLRDHKKKEDNEPDQVKNFEERYSIKVDNRLWLIAGKTNGHLQFKSSPHYVSKTSCALIPKVSGILPLPQLRIETTPMTRVKELNSKEDSIIVYPCPVILSLCEKIEVADSKKDYLLLNKPEGELEMDKVTRGASASASGVNPLERTSSTALLVTPTQLKNERPSPALHSNQPTNFDPK